MSTFRIVRNGLKMYYSDEEILKLYKEAKSKPHEIAVLAELNDCTVMEMADYLSHLLKRQLLGDERIDPIPESETATEQQIRKLWEAGRTDVEILEQTSASISEIKQWRSKYGHWMNHPDSKEATDWEAVRLMRDLGMAADEVCRATGLHKERVNKLRHRYVGYRKR